MAVAACARRAVPIVTQGGLTGLVHGAQDDAHELILSLERMSAIEDIDPVQRVAVVQAGVPLQALQEAADKHDLSFPLDFGARGSATLGGAASTNAGGNRVVRYGMTRALILGLEVVLADGTIVSSLNRLVKNNTGYDLKQLFIGAEGTLGVITRLALRLQEKAAAENVALLAVTDFEKVCDLLKRLDRGLGGGLSAFEVMWREFYQLVTTSPRCTTPPLPDEYPFYVLVEALGGDPVRSTEQFVALLETEMENGAIADAVIASSDRERRAIWSLRDDVVQIHRYGPAITFDVSLPLARIDDYVSRIRSDIAERWPDHHCWVYGHLGDSNLHIVVRVPDATRERPRVERVVYSALDGTEGSISAEHGVGLEKKPYLHLSRNPQEIALMRRLKAALDPENLFNPGKIFDLTAQAQPPPSRHP